MRLKKNGINAKKKWVCVFKELEKWKLKTEKKVERSSLSITVHLWADWMNTSERTWTCKASPCSHSSVMQMIYRLSFISPEQIKEAAFNPAIITLRSLSYHGGITVIKMGYSAAPGPRSFVMAWGRLKDGSCWRWAWAGGKSSWGTAAIILISCAERLHAILIASRGIFNKYFIQRSIITA